MKTKCVYFHKIYYNSDKMKAGNDITKNSILKIHKINSKYEHIDIFFVSQAFLAKMQKVKKK